MLHNWKLLSLLFVLFLSFSCSDSNPEVIDSPIVDPNLPEEGDSDYDDKPLVGKDDIRLIIESGTASEYSNSGENIDKAFDGDYSTLYHSRYRLLQNSNTFPTKPVVLELTLEPEAKDLDYIMLYPRKGSDNGIIIEGELFVKKDDMNDYPSQADISFSFDGASSTVRILELTERVEKPVAIKLVITKGQNDYVSLGEIELYTRIPSSDYTKYYKYFTDYSCSELVGGYTREQLKEIEEPFFRTIALKLYDKKYPVDERVIKVKTYPHPGDMKNEAVMNFEYGIYDNATGIYANDGENITVFVDELVNSMSLAIVNPTEKFDAKQTIPLRKGVNMFKAKSKGLMYILYQGNNSHTAKVHIANGEINGLYDKSRHQPSQWGELIEKATYTHFDMLGDKAHVIFTVDDLRKIDGAELLDIYDEIVQLGQDFTGMTKYKHIPASRLCFMASNEATHMHTYYNRTAYNLSTMVNISDPKKLKSTHLWGPVHEVGHVHQVTPGMNWGGGASEAASILEVTNNLNSLYVQDLWRQRSRMELQNDYEHAYQAFFVDKSKFSVALNETLYKSKTADMRLISFWQLQLYFGYAMDNKDFYADLHEETRKTSYTSSSYLTAMNRFALNASKVSEHNLISFFESYGYTIWSTTKNEIKNLGYPEPSIELCYITDSNKDMYRSDAGGVIKGNNAEIKEVAGGYEISIMGWKNVVAYEVYDKMDKLIYASPNTKFVFLSSENAIKIKAVGANKSRFDAGGYSK